MYVEINARMLFLIWIFIIVELNHFADLSFTEFKWLYLTEPQASGTKKKTQINVSFFFLKIMPLLCYYYIY